MSRQKASTEYITEPQKTEGPSRLTTLSLKIFRSPASGLSKRMPKIRRALLKSGTRTPPENYLSVVILLTVLAIPVSLTGIFIFYITLGFTYGLFLLLIPPVVFLAGLAKPWLSYSSKAKAVDTELPYVVSYFSLLSGGGISLLVTLRRISRVRLFPVLSKEAKQILTDIDMTGMDPVSALEQASRSTPNKYLADFLSGYTTLLRAGGQLGSYMDAKIREIFTHRVMSMKSSSGTISLYAEAYVAATVVMGLSFYLIFTMQSIVNQTGLTGLSNAIFFSSVFIPMISIVFFYLVDLAQVKTEPSSTFPLFKAVSLGLIAVPIMIFIPLDLPLYVRVGVGLMLLSVPPMIKYERESRVRRSIESMLPNFLRDIAEVRKTGLSPERCIQQVSKRNYGRLSQYVQKMSSQIGWGVPIRRVMENFANSIKVWSAKAVTFILLEVVDLGGGTAKMFENIAEFTQQMKEIAKEQSSTLKPLIFVPYFGAVMMITATMMMMNFMVGSTGEMAGSDPAFIHTALLTGVVAQSWIMGFASGKMGDGSMGAGFKHSIALSAISIVTIFILQFSLSGGL
ncbi:MAG: type II secretion system F family protein [Nitrososphaerales archaeon]